MIIRRGSTYPKKDAVNAMGNTYRFSVAKFRVLLAFPKKKENRPLVQTSGGVKKGDKGDLFPGGKLYSMKAGKTGREMKRGGKFLATRLLQPLKNANTSLLDTSVKQLDQTFRASCPVFCLLCIFSLRKFPF